MSLYGSAYAARKSVPSRSKTSVRAVKEKLAESNQYKSDPYAVPIDVQEDLPKTIAAMVGEYRGKRMVA